MGLAAAVEGFWRRRGDRVRLMQGPTIGGSEQGFLDPVLRVPMVFHCVELIVNQLRSYPARVLNRAGVEADPPGWVLDPNPLMSMPDALSAIGISLLLDGNAYVMPLRQGGSGEVVGFGVANPAYVSHYTVGGRVRWWVNGVETSDYEFVHIRSLTGPGRVEGLSRRAAMRPLTDISKMSLQYSLAVLTRGAAYQIVVKGTRRLGDDQDYRDEVRDYFAAMHSGPSNAYNLLMLPGDLEVMPLEGGVQNADDRYLQLGELTDKQIARMFHIDPHEVGIGVEGASRTYANEKDNQVRLYNRAVAPVANRVEEGLSALLPAGLSFDLHQEKQLRGGPHDRMALADKAALTNERSIKAGLGPVFSPEEIRELYGLPGPPPELPEPAADPAAAMIDNDSEGDENDG